MGNSSKETLRRVKYVVVHPGRAHMDDFICVSIALALLYQGCPVYRREPTTVELDDPYVLVFDVGDRWEPEKLNFDHHQWQNGPFALALFLRYLGLEDLFRTLPWFSWFEAIDTLGLLEAKKKFNFTEVPPPAPLEGFLLAEFSRVNTLGPSALRDMMLRFGENILYRTQNAVRNLDRVRPRIQTLLLDGETILFIPDLDKNEIALLNAIQREEFPEAIISIVPDIRGSGWCFHRFTDRINFFAIAKDPKVRFVHSTGFVGSTVEKIPIEEVLELIRITIQKSKTKD
jgi:hypothetical protein